MLEPCWRNPKGLPPGTLSTAPKVGVVARWMSSGGGGEEGRGGGTSREDVVDVVGNRLSGMKGGGSIVFGGGGCRGGGGRIIMGGRDLSTTEGTLEGVRVRTTISSTAVAKVDSIETFLSDKVLRGRDMNVGMESLRFGEGEATIGNEAVVGLADGGAEMNWNCCDEGPTRNNVGDGARAGVEGVDTGGSGGDQ